MCLKILPFMGHIPFCNSFSPSMAFAGIFTLLALFSVPSIAQDASISELLQQLELPPEMAPELEAALKQPADPAIVSSTVPPSTMTAPSGNSSCAGAPEKTCLPPNTDGPINQKLNSPIENGIFTFYGAGGRGACGLDIDQPKMSAAASGQLFNSDAKWVESCLPDKRSLLDDPFCKGICVKIDYNGKSLTVPVNNKCYECDPGHVDLSIDAFNYLEPKGGEVGKATGATITYLKCDGSVPC